MSPATPRVALLFQSPGAAVLNAPDNITVSPRGGLVLCEDGSGEELLNGQRNGFVGDFRGTEWAGACYSRTASGSSPTCRAPGSPSAITGAWRNGAL